jgi:hypothetical protein
MDKDCECLDSIHAGPHELYMDELTDQMLLAEYTQLIEKADPIAAMLLMREHAIESIARLERKQRAMQRNGLS